MKTLAAIIAPVVLLGAGYLWYHHALSARQRAEIEGAPGTQRQPAAARPRTRGPVVGVLLGTIAGIVFLFLGANRLEEARQARHPPVKEHLAELMELAARQLGCPQDRVTIFPEKPVRARATGCGKDVTLLWERISTQRGPAVWHEIDPNCTFDYMGWVRPCH